MSSSRLWVLAVLLALAIPAFAQVPVGSIRGSVKDSSGAIVPGANVTIRNTDTAQTRTVVSGEDGEYLAPSLPVGRYDVTVEHGGFKTSARQGVTLNVGDNLALNFELEIGTAQQEVTVTGEAPLVNTENSTLGGLVNEQQMSDLPLNGRNYMDLSLMQPGVTQDRNNGGYQGASTQYSSNGAPVRSNNFTLDGAPITTLMGRAPTSESGNSMGVDGIKEFKVITSNFTAEYGMAMGSQMAMVSANGTNRFHGDVFEFLRNSALDARNYFDLPPSRLNGLRLPEFQKNNFGGSVGGPIKKDKTFFYGVYEGLRQKLGVSPLITVPADACHPAVATAANNYGAGTVIWNGTGTRPAGSVGPCTQLGAESHPERGRTTVTLNPLIAPLFWSIYPNSSNPSLGAPNSGATGYSYPSSDLTHENYGQMRVDETFSAADTAFVRYTIEDDNFDNNGSTLAPVAASSSYPQYRTGGGSRNQYLSLVENHVFSPSLLNTARLSGSRTAYKIQDEYNGSGALVGPQFSFAPGQPTGRIYMSGGITAYAPGQNNPAVGTQSIYTLSDDITYTRGKHAFKFGTLINRFYDGINQTRSESGIIRFNNGGLKTFLTDTNPSNLEESPPGTNQDRHYVWNTFGFYGQDDWRATSRLTLNIGLRYEFMTTVTESNGLQANFHEPGHLRNTYNWPDIPRPFIPQLQPAPRFRLRSDRGRKNCNSRWLRNLLRHRQHRHGSPADGAGFGAILGRRGANQSAPFTSLPLKFPPGGLVPQTINYNAYQPDLFQYNLTVEHQFPGNTLVSVSYAGSRGAHLWTVEEGNPRIPTYVNGQPLLDRL